MGSLLSRGPGADTRERGAVAAPPAADAPPRTTRGRRPWLVVAVTGLVVLGLGVALASSGREPAWTVHPPAAVAPLPYAGTNYYSPSWTDCPFYSAWTPSCYGQARDQIAGDMRYLEEHGGPGLQRLWISLDQLFSCFDPETGFCGYDEQALADVVDTLRIMDRYHQKADLVLFAQSNRDSDVHSFHFEALDGEHPQMRAGYLEAARQFVQRIAADEVAASTVAVIDMENEGYFQNREALRDRSVCDSDHCIDEQLSRPFFSDLYHALKTAAPRFLYTVSALRAELLGPDQAEWIPMYPVDVYDVHLYITDPGSHTALFSRAANLPKPWFVGEAGTANHSHSDEPCFTYDGDDPCTAQTAAWFRAHLGPEYRAQAVLVENASTVIGHSAGAPALTDTGRAIAQVRPGS